MSTYYSGRVHTISFENVAQSFYILRMVLDGGNPMPVVVKGTIPGLVVKIGAWIPFEGDWITHEKFGRQLGITKAPAVPTWDAHTASSILITYGLSGTLSGALRDTLGDRLVSVLDTNGVAELQQVPGVDEKTAAYIISRWQTARAYIQTLGFLADVGVPKAKVSKVWAVFGEKASQVLSENPWALVQIDGISFQQADDVAAKLGLFLDNPKRLEGAILHAVRDQRGMGHLFLRSGEIVQAVEGVCAKASHQEIAGAIKSLAAEGRLVVDKTARPGFTGVYEPWMHRVEDHGARLLLDRMQTAQPTDIVERFQKSLNDVAMPSDPVACATIALGRWAQGSHINLSPDQHNGVVNALTQPVSVLTGLPGTGKTTSLRAAVQISRDIGLRCLLIAPTGIAAKRMSSVTGMPASTIHRAFGAKGWAEGRDERESTYVGVTGGSDSGAGSDGSEEMWGCSAEPYPADIVFVDEASMVDQHLLYRILTCTSATTRIVFIGDAAQLPSVGPGNVLRDLVAAKVFPTVSLHEIYRQADTSAIVVAAHAINAGEAPELRPGSDFVFVSQSEERAVLDLVLDYAKKLSSKKINFQVMSPRHAGTVGVTNLNSAMREAINPKHHGTVEVRIGSEVLREFDKVMVVRNNYELGIFNGDVGHVKRIDNRSGDVEVEIVGDAAPLVVRIPLKSAGELLRLAYAVTVHKMQGQESDVIIIPWVTGFRHQLQRNLLYTAITRAKKKAILIGHWGAVVTAVGNDQNDVRNTMFYDRLQMHAAQK